jgi:hypothetical protein
MAAPCGGCNRTFAAASLTYKARQLNGNAIPRRCKRCGAKRRFWTACLDCGTVRCCTDLQGDGAAIVCARCARIRDLALGKVAGVTWRGAVKVSETEREALYDLHLQEFWDVDFWVAPESGELCLLTQARLILFRRWGMNVGLVRGAGAATWSNGRKSVNLAALAEHLEALRQAGRWPEATSAREPVLLSCTTAAQVKQVVLKLRAMGWTLAQLARLAAMPFSLSEQGATAGFDFRLFMQAPTTAPGCEQTRRCKRAVGIAANAIKGDGLLDGAGVFPLSHPSSAAAAFRRMLFA